jgi:hypothetical protein
MKNISDKSCRETRITHFTFSIFFKPCLLRENVEKKCCRAGQATDGNMARAQCMLDTYGYKHTHKLCSTDCFSAPTMVHERTSGLVKLCSQHPILSSQYFAQK